MKYFSGDFINRFPGGRRGELCLVPVVSTKSEAEEQRVAGRSQTPKRIGVESTDGIAIFGLGLRSLVLVSRRQAGSKNIAYKKQLFRVWV